MLDSYLFTQFSARIQFSEYGKPILSFFIYFVNESKKRKEFGIHFSIIVSTNGFRFLNKGQIFDFVLPKHLHRQQQSRDRLLLDQIPSGLERHNVSD